MKSEDSFSATTTALIVIVLIAVATVGFGYLFSFVTIGQGQAGVLSWFGSVEDKPLQPGAHLVNPFKSVVRMNCQTLKDEEPATVPTKKGLMVQINATLLWHLDPVQAPRMANEVGSDYAKTVVSPSGLRGAERTPQIQKV